MNLKHTICFVDKLTTTSLLMVDNDLESLAGLEDSNDDDLDSLEGVIVYLPDKIMFTGLVLVKYKRRRIKRAGGGGGKETWRGSLGTSGRRLR